MKRPTELEKRQEEIDAANREEEKSKAPPPQKKTLCALLNSVRTLVPGFEGKDDVDIFEIAGYGNQEEALRAYREAVQSDDADDGLVRNYLTGLLGREASSLIEASFSTNTPPA